LADASAAAEQDESANAGVERPAITTKANAEANFDMVPRLLGFKPVLPIKRNVANESLSN
jgi:hypothetical protein